MAIHGGAMVPDPIAPMTDDWIDLGESGNEELNRKMELLLSKLSEQPSVTIKYFVPDEHKEGGSYQSYTGHVKRIDEYEQTMVMTDGKKIFLRMITNITIIGNESK